MDACVMKLAVKVTFFCILKLGAFYDSLNFLFISEFVNILCNDINVYNVYSAITPIRNHDFLTNVMSLHVGFACVQHNFKKNGKTSL
jgi:hypothetical protein